MRDSLVFFLSQKMIKFRASFYDATFSEKPSLVQSCHVDVEAGKFLADGACSSLRRINDTLILQSADITGPEKERL